jgi:hypothetical protein
VMHLHPFHPYRLHQCRPCQPCRPCHQCRPCLTCRPCLPFHPFRGHRQGYPLYPRHLGCTRHLGGYPDHQGPAGPRASIVVDAAKLLHIIAAGLQWVVACPCVPSYCESSHSGLPILGSASRAPRSECPEASTHAECHSYVPFRCFVGSFPCFVEISKWSCYPQCLQACL